MLNKTLNKILIKRTMYRWWFGGGSDLTPYYLDEEDGKLFHTTLKTACDKHDKGLVSHFRCFHKPYIKVTGCLSVCLSVPKDLDNR